MFVMYKDLSKYQWINKSNDKLIPENYTVCINPEIKEIHPIHHYEYEECASFKM
jgi:hypothetical protein